MSRNCGSNVTLLDNDNDPGENPLLQHRQPEGLTQLELATLPLVPFNPTVSTCLRIIHREPATLFTHIKFLERRITQLLDLNRNIMSENTRLKAQIEGMTRTTTDLSPEASISMLQFSTNSGTSVHEVSIRPRFGFPSVASVSLTDVRSSAQIVIPTSSSATTAIPSPGLTIMYLRRGVEVHPVSTSCALSYSDQVVVLQQPVFHDTQVSDTSIMELMDSRESSEFTIQNTGTAVSGSDSVDCRRFVTYSLPHIVTFPSVSNITDHTVEDSDSEITSELRPAHSWPSFRRPYLGDFATLLSRYLDDTTDSEYDLDEDTEHDSNVDDDDDADLISDETDLSGHSTVSVPATRSTATPVTPAVLREQEPYPYVSVVEHPFIEPLRGIHEVNVLRSMFGLNEPVRNLPYGRLLYRRRGITLFPSREPGASSWTRKLRAQIFLNVNLESVSERSDESEQTDTDVTSTDSIDSMQNEASDMNLPDLAEHDEGDGEQIDAIDEPNGEEPEEFQLGDQEDTENSSSTDSGRGDAESVVSSSSTTSLSSHASETAGAAQAQSPTFPYPSESNLGGKYGCLKAAIRRPRAPDGHRFVVSVFGTVGRRTNELNLPSWVPVYAERLECILNQFLDKTDSNQQIGPVMKVLHSTAQSHSHHSYRSVVTCTASQEKRLERIELPTSSQPGQLKSCLRVSREGSTGEAIPRNISWSQKIIMRSVGPLGLPDLDAKHEIIPTATAPTKEAIPNAEKSQSCPDILLGCAKEEIFIGETGNKEIPNPVEDEFPSEKKETKKKGFVSRVFGKFWCSCTNGLRKSSSLECQVSGT